MTPYSILALAETASYEQVPVLKDAIHKHLAHCASMKIVIVGAAILGNLVGIVRLVAGFY